jgi:hypothetical protein
MMMMPMMTRDDVFHQGRENNNQQMMGAKVMAATGNENAGVEGWVTLAKNPPRLPLL